MSSEGSKDNPLPVNMASWSVIQTTLLVLHHGFGVLLPWWVLWFPSLAFVAILVLVGFIMVVGVALR